MSVVNALGVGSEGIKLFWSKPKQGGRRTVESARYEFSFGTGLALKVAKSKGNIYPTYIEVSEMREFGLDSVGEWSDFIAYYQEELKNRASKVQQHRLFEVKDLNKLNAPTSGLSVTPSSAPPLAGANSANTAAAATMKAAEEMMAAAKALMEQAEATKVEATKAKSAKPAKAKAEKPAKAPAPVTPAAVNIKSAIEVAPEKFDSMTEDAKDIDPSTLASKSVADIKTKD